jgi:predicted amidohydrolase YtcJ
MKKSAVIGLLGMSVLLTGQAWVPPSYTAVIIHSKILTHEDVDSSIDSVAISGTKIAALGQGETLSQNCSSPCTVIDAKGGFLMPGFNDSHVHVAPGGAQFFRVQVSGSDVKPIAAAVKEFATAHPDDPWIIGRGWDAAGFGTHFPSRKDLDQGESKRPVVLSDSDSHQLWVNTAAITAAGITKDTPDPEGGTILREADGSPTGVFLENATDLIENKMPEPTPEQMAKYINKGQQVATEAGYTSQQGGPVSLDTAQTFANLDAQGKLTSREFLWLDLTASDEDFQKLVDFAHSLPENGKVRVTAFKGFVDGVISSYTAAMLNPYEDHQDLTGSANFTQDELNGLVLRANRAGFPVALHSIGDRAVRMSLDAFEYSDKILGYSLLNRIEHIESLDPTDAPRFAKLNVLASMQPTHMHFDSAASSYYPTRLGPERLKHAFAWNELYSQGAMLVFGTDFPIVDEDPIEGMFCATHREYYDGTEFEAWQKVDGKVAFDAYTTNPAYAIGFSDRIGQIKAGYEADLILLNKNPVLGEAQSLFDNPPLMMWIAGTLIFNNQSH